MRKAYLLAYSAALGTLDEIKGCLDSIPEILHWRHDLPNTFILISEEHAKKLSELIRSCRGNTARFMITEIANDNYWGWMSLDAWYVVLEKEPPSKETSARLAKLAKL